MLKLAYRAIGLLSLLNFICAGVNLISKDAFEENKKIY